MASRNPGPPHPAARKQRSTRHARRHDQSHTPRRYWSAEVMKHSDALDLDQGVFRLTSPQKIAASLKHSAENSRRRKGTPYQSAMSMLNFYINRAGRTLSAGRKRLLERTKPELRKAFGRTERTARSKPGVSKRRGEGIQSRRP